MRKPVVDVVVATNRRSPYLSQALASLVTQTYYRWRLILVDDGCPDPDFIADAVRGVPGSRLVRQAPAGLPAARNAGIAAGDGELVAFLDDDDIWSPDKLTAQVDALSAMPTSIGSYTGGWYMDAHGVVFGAGWQAEASSPADFISGRVPTPRVVTLMVRREALLALGGFNESYSLAEDNEFILRLVQHGHLASVAQPMVGYRRHDSNMSSAGGLDERLANRRLLLEQMDAAQRRGDLETYHLLAHRLVLHRREWAAETVRGVAHASRSGAVGSAVRQLAWGLRVSPGGVVSSAFGKTLARTAAAVASRASTGRGAN